MKEIRYNSNNWDAKDYKKVFGLTPKSVVDIKIGGKFFKKCKLKFFYVGPGFFMIDVEVPGEVLGISLHDGCSYPSNPFCSPRARRDEIKISFRGHTYQWKCGNNRECEFCGKSEKDIDNCKFYLDGEETIFSLYFKDSLAIKS